MVEEEEKPFKAEFKISGCPFRDRSELNIYVNAMSLYSSLHEVDEAIRSRLKWGENLGDEEVKFLETLRNDIEIWRYE